MKAIFYGGFSLTNNKKADKLGIVQKPKINGVFL